MSEFKVLKSIKNEIENYAKFVVEIEGEEYISFTNLIDIESDVGIYEGRKDGSVQPEIAEKYNNKYFEKIHSEKSFWDEHLKMIECFNKKNSSFKEFAYLKTFKKFSCHVHSVDFLNVFFVSFFAKSVKEAKSIFKKEVESQIGLKEGYVEFHEYDLQNSITEEFTLINDRLVQVYKKGIYQKLSDHYQFVSTHIGYTCRDPKHFFGDKLKKVNDLIFVVD